MLLVYKSLFLLLLMWMSYTCIHIHAHVVYLLCSNCIINKRAQPRRLYYIASYLDERRVAIINLKRLTSLYTTYKCNILSKYKHLLIRDRITRLSLRSISPVRLCSLGHDKSFSIIISRWYSITPWLPIK